MSRTCSGPAEHLDVGPPKALRPHSVRRRFHTFPSALPASGAIERITLTRSPASRAATAKAGLFVRATSMPAACEYCAHAWPRGAGLEELWHGIVVLRPDERADRHLRGARRQRAQGRSGAARQARSAGGALSAWDRRRVRLYLRHLRAEEHPERLHRPVRCGCAGGSHRRSFPAAVPHDAFALHRHSSSAGRVLLGPLSARLLDQHAQPSRQDPRRRPRRRRCDRGGRERHPDAEGQRPEARSSGQAVDERGDGPDPRDHAGAARPVHPGRVRSRSDRKPLQPVRADDSGDGLDLVADCADPHGGAVADHAACARRPPARPFQAFDHWFERAARRSRHGIERLGRSAGWSRPGSVC